MTAGQGDQISTSEQHLTVIGAGPKAVAIAAKRRVLSARDVVVPQLSVIDPNGLAAYWKGEHGYTDGRSPLGTPPEKDVGYPYASTGYGDRAANRAVDEAMMQHSWMAFRIQHPTQNYAEWIDRGKPQPIHEHWADYLHWVASRVDLDVELEQIACISVKDGRWRLVFASGRQLFTDGLVVTSPGPPRSKFVTTDDSDWVFNGQNFWLARNQERIRVRSDDLKEKRQTTRACVVGSGETAAAIVVQLAGLLPPETPIDVVSRGGIVYTRGESHDENRLYSKPDRWLEFPLDVRTEFVKRTDRGVFSVANKETLNQAYGVETIAGDVEQIDSVQGGYVVRFRDRKPRGYELVVDATGFRPEWFLDLMDDEATSRLADAFDRNAQGGNGFSNPNPFASGTGSADDRVEGLINSIEADLSVKGLHPALHLPMLAARNQGPGFPNLSCLGLVSDRVLQPYTVAAPKADVDKPDEDLAPADS